jgi:hypothetical protein
MKNTLLTLTLIGSLLPLSSLQARTYGGFEPFKRFKLTVTKVTSVKRTGLTLQTDAAIPAGIPSYRLGERVKFTIGRRGGLTARGLNLAFKNGNRNVNNYLNPVTAGSLNIQAAGVSKTATGQPANMIINYQKVEGTGSSIAIYNVSYQLRR